MFSFSLICESISALILTFVPHGEQTLVEKDSYYLRTTKSSFFSRSANFGKVSSFLGGKTNTFSELIHPLLKLPNCVLKFYNLSEARLFRLTPSSRSRHRLCWRTANSTNFWSSTLYTIFYYIHYISQRSNAKNCFRITRCMQREESEPSADSNTRYSPSKSITECIKVTKRVELWTDFWELDDIFEPPGRNELIVWKTDSRFFFFSRLLRVCEARALRARKTFTPHCFVYWFWGEKNDCFAV